MKRYLLVTALAAALPVAALTTTLGDGKIAPALLDGWPYNLQTFRVTFTRPATRENGKAFAYSELKEYELYRTALTATTTDKRILARSATGINLRQPVCTTYHYAIAARAVDGSLSKLSDVLTLTTHCPS